MKPIDLAKRLGINRAIISQYLNGRYSPNLNRLYDIAKILNINESYLLGLDVEIENIDDEVINLYKYNKEFLSNQDKEKIKKIIIDKVRNKTIIIEEKEHES